MCTVMLAVFVIGMDAVLNQLATSAPDAPPSATAPAHTQPATEQLTICGETFTLELAPDSQSRSKGLMHRDNLAADRGMLFIYPRPELLHFWMANCLIDIDLICLDSNGRILALHKMKRPPPKNDDETQEQYESRLKRYSSIRPAQFAIELRAGSIDRLELKRGQTIEADWTRLKKLAR